MSKRADKDVVSDGRGESAREPMAESVTIEGGPPHQVEEDVRRELLGHPRLRFSSLVVRRVRDGVCLEGVLEFDESSPDVSSLARRVGGVREVLNHLLIRREPTPEPPVKG